MTSIGISSPRIFAAFISSWSARAARNRSSAGESPPTISGSSAVAVDCRSWSSLSRQITRSHRQTVPSDPLGNPGSCIHFRIADSETPANSASSTTRLVRLGRRCVLPRWFTGYLHTHNPDLRLVFAKIPRARRPQTGRTPAGGPDQFATFLSHVVRFCSIFHADSRLSCRISD